MVGLSYIELEEDMPWSQRGLGLRATHLRRPREWPWQYILLVTSFCKIYKTFKAQGVALVVYSPGHELLQNLQNWDVLIAIS